MGIQYIIRFEKYEQRRKAAAVSENEVWIGVGNSVEMGCFDHHRTQEYDSTLMAILSNLNYLQNLKRCALDGRTITIHIRTEPNMDCIVCTYIVKCYLEYAKEEFIAVFGPGGYAASFISYVNDINKGKGKITDYPTLYALIVSLYSGKEKSWDTDKAVLERGEQLIGLAVQRLAENAEFDLVHADFSELVGAEYINEINTIKNSAYEEEKNSERVFFESLALWKKNGEAVDVPMAIWRDLPRDDNGYNYARREGNMVTVVPYSIKGKNDAKYTRVIVSINPDLDLQKEFTLKPIVEVIEQMEQVEEQRRYKRTGQFRRDYSRPREETGNLGEMPFSVTSDPWYISLDEDFFSSPRIYSLLYYDDIIEIIRNNGSMIKRSYIIGIDMNQRYENIYEKRHIPLSVWQNEAQAHIEQSVAVYKLLIAEVDASLIRHNHCILEAYCMNLIGRSFQERNETQFLYLDYRTCIYTDLNCTIVFIATYGSNSYSALPIAEILNIDSFEKICTSAFLDDIHKVLLQRAQLLEYGTMIGESIYNTRKYIEKLNDRLLSFSARVQQENIIRNYVEKDIYSYIQQKFEVSELQNSIMNEINILISESRNKLVSKFNVLSAFSVPFVLAATVFQMGLLKFDEIINLSGYKSVIGWAVTIVIIVLLIIIIMKAGTKKKDDG